MKSFTRVKDEKRYQYLQERLKRCDYLQYIKGVNQKKRQKDGNIYKS